MEPEVVIHQIRITLTSCNGVFGERVCWLDHRHKGKASQSEKISLDAYQHSKNHSKKNSL